MENQEKQDEEKPKILAQVTITGMSDGSVGITGNLPSNLDAAMDLIFAGAKIVAKQFIMAAQQGSATVGPPRIVIPKGPIVGMN